MSTCLSNLNLRNASHDTKRFLLTVAAPNLAFLSRHTGVWRNNGFNEYSDLKSICMAIRVLRSGVIELDTYGGIHHFPNLFRCVRAAARLAGIQ